MGITRRDALSLGAALLPGWIAGCLSGDSNVRYPRTEAEPPSSDAALRGNAPSARAADASDGHADAASELDEDASAADASPRAVPNRELARRTDRILDEVRWFATERDDAVEAYLKAVRKAARRVEELRGGEFDDDAFSDLEDAVSAALDVAREVVGAHFATDELLAENIEYHLGVIAKFHRRGDADRRDEELVRLRDFLRSVGTETYADLRMSAHPVQNRLFDRLLGDGSRPALFEIRYLPAGYAAYVYDRHRRRRRYATEPLTAYGRGDLGAFEPLSVAENRDDAAFVRPRPLPSQYAQEVADGSDGRGTLPAPPADPSDHPAVPVFLQRFADADAAGDALDALLADRVEHEGNYRIGADEWRRVYYRFDGDVTYAFLVQAGGILLATAPSETAWEERVGWNGPLRRSWLWREPTGETPQGRLADAHPGVR